MDGTVFQVACELIGAAAGSWALLAARWAQAGVSWRDWSPSTFCHVIADLLTQAAEQSGGQDQTSRALSRDRQARRMEDPDRVGTISAADAARILRGDG